MAALNKLLKYTPRDARAAEVQRQQGITLVAADSASPPALRREAERNRPRHRRAEVTQVSVNLPGCQYCG